MAGRGSSVQRGSLTIRPWIHFTQICRRFNIPITDH
jgi:hypothetical protein